ncbi:MAG TPA: GNAT family protein [Thermoanaerobaculia bacterium]|jgi:RimJ/RimL family protein N-acetyltransferase|nr:GNAT family protein [Thermoanaerobaculia bacterium]
MILAPIVLEGRSIRLEPLTLDHAAELYAHASPEIFEWMADWPVDESLAAYLEWERQGLEIPDSQLFAIVLRETREPIGSTAFLDARPEHRAIEIGRTWIGKAHQGTAANPESKLLLLRHAFESLGALRVQLKTDARNVHSQRAIEKLGAIREGTLRNYQIRADGRPRDTVMYSITAGEWPAVRLGLERRLEPDQSEGSHLIP